MVPADRQIQNLLRQMIRKIQAQEVPPLPPGWEAVEDQWEARRICVASISGGLLLRNQDADEIAVKAAATVQAKLGPTSATETSDNVRIAMEHKLVLFLVPRVPLVYQQAETIRVNTQLDVGEYCGDDNSDHGNLRAWNEEFLSRDVLVMTPQIMLNILRHGFIRLGVFQVPFFPQRTSTSSALGLKSYVLSSLC